MALVLRRVAPLLNDAELTDFLQSSKDKLKLLGREKSAFSETEMDSIELLVPILGFSLQCKEGVVAKIEPFGTAKTISRA